MIHVKKASEMPVGEHWAILEFSSVTIPGDERSRTNPGHGYSESKQIVIEYIAFTNQHEFRTEVEKRFEYDTKYRQGSSPSFTSIHVDKQYKPVVKVNVDWGS